MSITSELTRIADAVAAIKVAIEAMGVPVPSGSKIQNLAPLIYNIQVSSGPAALTSGDWTLSSEILGPRYAAAVISLPEANAIEVNWRASSSDPWLPTENAGGSSWRFLTALNEPQAFSAGTYSGIEIRYRQSGTTWSLPSVDSKGFTFTEATITPSVATISINLVAGFETSIDVLASGIFSGAWPMEFRLSGNSAPVYVWEDSRIYFYPSWDAVTETVDVTLEAYWLGEAEAEEIIAPLTNSVAPVITGNLTVGSILSVSNGTWSGSPDQIAYRWRVGGEIDPLEVTPTREIKSGEEGLWISCDVRVWNGAWSSWVSAAQVQVEESAGPPVYEPIVYLNRSVGNSVSTSAIPAGVVAGDFLVGMAFDTTAIGALSSPITDVAAGTQSRLGWFVLDNEVSINWPQTVYPILAAFSGDMELGDYAFSTNTGQVITFPSVDVIRPGSTVILAGFRNDSGGIGAVTYNIPGSSLIFHSGSSRQCALYLPDQSSNFTGATLTFGAASSLWSAMSIVLQPPA